MASNHFGSLFRITTWGESHGKAIGVVVDGCPAGVPLEEEEIQKELNRRMPASSPFVSPRKEKDQVQILSGLFEGKTTGTPISLLIWNEDADSKSYEHEKSLLKPGHAHYTYLQKYGSFDYRGGGRSSARETACRVAAGAIARKILFLSGITIQAYLQEVGGIACEVYDVGALQKSMLFCPDPRAEALIKQSLEIAQAEGDSLGGIVCCLAEGLPPGIGDPVYEKIEANLARGILSIPACKGIDFGAGFSSSKMRGSAHNDLPTPGENNTISMKTNHAGGILGGISTGMPISFRSAFKPTSSIKIPQESCSIDGKPGSFSPLPSARHDPCVAIRAVPVVEAMTAIVLADAYLMNRTARL